jgi:phospholipase C
MSWAKSWGFALGVCFFVLAEMGCGGGSSKKSSNDQQQVPASINHIVVLMQENRSFDNYFGRLGQYKRDHGIPGDVEDLPLDVTLFAKSGAPVQPFHFQTTCHENISPSWNQSHFYWDNGKMDLFMHTATQSTIDPDTTRAMGYYDQTDLPYYYSLASQYATSDRFFSPVMTETVPNRLYMMGATSWGATKAIGPFPQQYTLIWDRLTDAGINWKYYLPSATNFLAQFPGGAARYGSHFAPISQYFEDLKSDSSFPQVAFIERQEGLDEHPSNKIQAGARKVKSYIDALMQSPAWGTSAFFLVFDEGGGMYDHVPPVPMPPPDNIPPDLDPSKGDFIAGFDMTGFRVPFILVSPWGKPNFVSHIPRDHTAILKFIESRFNLPSLTARDAAQDNMSEFFDFNSPARISIPHLEDQPTDKDAVCSFDLEKAPGH